MANGTLATTRFRHKWGLHIEGNAPACPARLRELAETDEIQVARWAHLVCGTVHAARTPYLDQRLWTAGARTQARALSQAQRVAVGQAVDGDLDEDACVSLWRWGQAGKSLAQGQWI